MIGLFVIQLQPVCRMKQGRKAMRISGAMARCPRICRKPDGK